MGWNETREEGGGLTGSKLGGRLSVAAAKNIAPVMIELESVKVNQKSTGADPGREANYEPIGGGDEALRLATAILRRGKWCVFLSLAYCNTLSSVVPDCAKISVQCEG